MNRNNLISLIVFDIIVLVLAVALIFFRYNTIKNQPLNLEEEKTAVKTIPSEKEIPQEQKTDETQPPAPEKKEIPLKSDKIKDKNSTQLRNIRFTFRNSKARDVKIIGDFNGWIPSDMSKTENNTWMITLKIAPGEYAYNYIVDGKPIRDPNNRVVTNAGRGFLNSLLKVKPK